MAAPPQMAPAVSAAFDLEFSGRSSLHSLSPARPLLTVSRAEIEDYLREHQLEPRRDPSNADIRYRRNRLRQMVMPALDDFDPAAGRLLARAAEILAEEDHLLEEQMSDGGWNCQRDYGATHSSLHTTISVLEGLRLYELRLGRRARAIQAAQRRGREFLLVHRLFRSHRTGEVIKPILA